MNIEYTADLQACTSCGKTLPVSTSFFRFSYVCPVDEYSDDVVVSPICWQCMYAEDVKQRKGTA